MLPSFLCLKYQGVRAPAAILQESRSFAFKCRKYSRWQAVQVEPDKDRKLLLRVADDILEEGKLDRKDFPRLSEIWLKVQRWRVDKENFAIEPPLTESWESLNYSFKLAGERPESVRDSAGLMPFYDQKQSWKTVVDLWVLWQMDQFLAGSAKSVYESVPESVWVVGIPKNIFSAFSQGVVAVYSDLGMPIPLNKIDIKRLVADLGLELPKISQPASTTPVIYKREQDSVRVEYRALGKSVLVVPKSVQGQVLVLLSTDHPFIKRNSVTPEGKRVLEELFVGVGSVWLARGGLSESIEDLLGYLAHILRADCS